MTSTSVMIKTIKNSIIKLTYIKEGQLLNFNALKLLSIIMID